MPADPARDLCRYLEWDSQFFGVRIARLTADRLTPDVIAAAEAWSAREKIACLYFLADPAELATARLAQQHGFMMLDLRVSLVRDATPPDAAPAAVRPFSACDAEPLRAIARVSHRGSRFYSDPHFPESRCDDLYETWIERSYNGLADAVLVAEAGSVPAGYVTCHISESGVGSIGLLAVSKEARRQGLGRQLVSAARGFLHGRGMRSLNVITQGGNLESQRLYQHCGFVTESIGVWYHRWFSGGVSPR